MSEVTIRIKGDDDSDSAFRKARNNEERLTASAKAAGIELTVMGKKGELAGKITADGAERAHAGISRLNAGIGELDRGMDTLRGKFEETGDVDFLRQSKRLGTAKKELEGFRKELEQLVTPDGNDGRDAGLTFGRGIKTGIIGSVSDLPSQLKGSLMLVGATAAVAVAPALGAAVSLGVLGGVGLGGIVGGVALAAKDAQVAATAKEVGDKIGTSLSGAAVDHFKQPIIESLRIFEDGFDKIEPKIEHTFGNLAPHLTTLAHGAADSIDTVISAVDVVSGRAGPVIDEIAHDMPIIAEGIGNFIDQASQGGPGAVQFMHDFSTSIKFTLTDLGLLVHGLSELYAFSRNNPFGSLVGGASSFGDAVLDSSKRSSDGMSMLGLAISAGPSSALLALTGRSGDTKKALFDLDQEQRRAAEAAKTHEESLATLGLGVDLAAADFAKLGGAITATAQTTDVLAGAMTDKIINTSMNLDQAVLGVAEAQTSLTAAIADNGRALDIHTEKGQHNREAVLSVVSANLRQYDSLISSGVGAQDAAAAYDSNTAALEKQMRQAGFTQGEIDGLIGKYRAVPDRVNTNIAMEGLTAAIAGLDETIRLINHLPSRRTVYVDVVTSQVGGPVGAVSGGRVSRANAHGGVVGAASGGARNGLTMVGEHGFELLNLPPGTTVHSNEDSRRMLGGAVGAPTGGRSVLEVRPAPGFDSAIMRVFLEMIETAIRTDPAFAGAIAAAGT